jgi:hypothetical protein
MTDFYERGSFQIKWTVTVLLFGLAVVGSLASGWRPLIAASGLLVVLAGLVLARCWGGLTPALASAYRRFGLPIPVRLIRVIGGVIVLIGAVWTIGPILSYLQ